jgi:hypothetical protein
MENQAKYGISFINQDGNRVEWSVRFHSRSIAQRALRFVKKAYALNNQAEIV